MSHFGENLLPSAVSEPAVAICLNSLMFGRRVNKINAELYFERKVNFTLFIYLYNAKLTHGEISMSDFIAKVTRKYSLESLNM